MCISDLARAGPVSGGKAALRKSLSWKKSPVSAKHAFALTAFAWVRAIDLRDVVHIASAEKAVTAARFSATLLRIDHSRCSPPLSPTVNKLLYTRVLFAIIALLGRAVYDRAAIFRRKVAFFALALHFAMASKVNPGKLLKTYNICRII